MHRPCLLNSPDLSDDDLTDFLHPSCALHLRREKSGPGWWWCNKKSKVKPNSIIARLRLHKTFRIQLTGRWTMKTSSTESISSHIGRFIRTWCDQFSNVISSSPDAYRIELGICVVTEECLNIAFTFDLSRPTQVT